MKKAYKTAVLAAIFMGVGFISGSSFALNILLTNDDGYNSAGITAMRAGLTQAGHTVTIVAPKENHSADGGSITIPFVSGEETYVNVIMEEPDVWSVEGTAADCVRAALGAVMAANPPDLLVSGANFGENTGKPAASLSGTIHAAITAVNYGIPAIAVSVGILYPLEYPDFQSTFAAYPGTAYFIAQIIQKLLDTSGPSAGTLLPNGTFLSINIPVPVEGIKGVRFTNLAQYMVADVIWRDTLDVIAQGGGPVLVTAEYIPGPDPVLTNDTDAQREGYISLGLLTTDLTVNQYQQSLLQYRISLPSP